MSDEGEELYEIGDRVILHGLQGAAHVNGRHGTISSGGGTASSGRFPVDLDLWDSNAPQTLAVKAANLRREPPLLEEAVADRATVQDGIFTEKFIQPLSLLLDLMRLISAGFFFRDDGVNDTKDITDMRRKGGLGLFRLNRYMPMAWAHWLDPGGYHTPENRGVYEILRVWAHSQLEGREESELAAMPEHEKTFLLDSVEHPMAVKGWNVRIHGDFWVVSMDNNGTYLVPAENTKRVYQVLGICEALNTMFFEMHPRPVLVKLTVIPFYGRLVCDGDISPSGFARSYPMANAQKTEKLHLAVEAAKEERRVVDRLRQLEVPGGSRKGLHEQKNPTIIKKKNQEPPTVHEATLVEALKKITPYPADICDGMWLMGRLGYTEHHNPDHIMCITRTPKDGKLVTKLEMFSVEKLEPSAIEILEKTLEVSKRIKKRPSVLQIDDVGCYHRVEFLLKDVAGTKVKYFVPLTKEHLADVLRNVDCSDATVDEALCRFVAEM